METICSEFQVLAIYNIERLLTKDLRVTFDLLNIFSKIKLNSSPNVENYWEENDANLFDRDIGMKIKLED